MIENSQLSQEAIEDQTFTEEENIGFQKVRENSFSTKQIRNLASKEQLKSRARGVEIADEEDVKTKISDPLPKTKALNAENLQKL